MINHQWRRLKITLPAFVSWPLTFLCVLICWVFFRADNFSSAIAILAAMTDIHNVVLPSEWIAIDRFAILSDLGIYFGKLALAGSLSSICVKLLVIGFILAVCPNPPIILSRLQTHPRRLQVLAGVLGLVFAFTILSIGHVESEFLYFQF